MGCQNGNVIKGRIKLRGMHPFFNLQFIPLEAGFGNAENNLIKLRQSTFILGIDRMAPG